MNFDVLLGCRLREVFYDDGPREEIFVLGSLEVWHAELFVIGEEDNVEFAPAALKILEEVFDHVYCVEYLESI
jgi:hypothetical protein